MVDQRIDTYSVKTKSRRWATSALAYTLDTARVNAQTVFALNNGKNPRNEDSYDAIRELGEALIAEQLLRRYNGSTNGISLDIQGAIKNCLVNYENPHSPVPEHLARRFNSSDRSVCAECRQENMMLDIKARKQVPSTVDTKMRGLQTIYL